MVKSFSTGILLFLMASARTNRFSASEKVDVSLLVLSIGLCIPVALVVFQSIYLEPGSLMELVFSWNGSTHKIPGPDSTQQKIAGSGAKYASSAAGTDTSVIVEVLANPASTVTNLAEAGIDLNQSVKRSEDRSQGLTSSLRWMLKSSLGYSDSCESDVFREVSCDESEPSEEGEHPVFEGTLVGDENLGRISCEPESISPACMVSIGLFDKGALPRTESCESIVFERQMLLGKSWF
jgi:hypothetical protein